RRVGVDGVLLGLRVGVRVLLRERRLRDVLLLAFAAATREAARATARLRRGCVLIGLAVVRGIGVGVVARRLIRRARTTAHAVSSDADGNVRVDRVLLCLRIRVGVLLGLRRLIDVLLLTIAAAARVTAARAARLGGRCILVGLAAVRRVSVCLVAHILCRRARAAQHAVSGDVHRDVRIDRVLLGLRVGVRVLLRERGLRDVLLLAVAAAARGALGGAARLRCGCGLIGVALVRGIGVGLV